MTVLTLTPLPELGAVRVEVTAAPAGPLTITRTDNNGTAEVRLYAAQEPIGGALTVVDHDPALVGTVTYSADTATASTTVDRPDLVMLHDPVRPNRRAYVDALTGHRDTAANPSPVLDALGIAEPIVIRRPLGTPRGSLELAVPTRAAALAVRSVAEAGRPVLFRQGRHDGLDQVLHVSTVAIAAVDEHAWAVTLDYVDQASPTGPVLASAAWTVADVAAAYATVAEVAAAFATVADLTAGP